MRRKDLYYHMPVAAVRLSVNLERHLVVLDCLLCRCKQCIERLYQGVTPCVDGEP